LLIFIVRHGETDYNKAGRIQGQHQFPLNETGRNQALQVAASLKNYRITHIYCSGLGRARETAEIIDKSFLLPVITDDRLNERYFGAWEGKNRDDLLALNIELKNI
jgi:broad specificity phosphatase PhoE